MKALMPRIEISLSQIRHNAQVLSELYGQQGISLMGVSKAVLGDPAIAQAMIEGGVKFIADSRLENIQRMKNAGVSAQFVLLRTALSQAESVIENVDISLNTELATITALDRYASLHNKIHQIVVMVELGDLREGVLKGDLSQFIKKTLALSHIKIIGIGCNLACFGGIKPDNNKMRELSQLADAIEREFSINLEIISGGNSANYEWYKAAQKVGRINNLRLGELILLGCETVNRKLIPGLHANAFKLIAEVIESKEKPSLPFGEICQNAFGSVPTFLDRGLRRRIIVALGRQDVLVSGLKPSDDLEILGSSSDHVVLDSNNYDLQVGSEVKFSLDYGGLLAAMTSPFINKQFVNYA
ncbi:alanine/ornithine racemase family PLP-dependent enzyme [Synechocystis sp. PCC 7509]|uniref:alanine/ornithine racemase family PLP-dependent enzyme n=1 Tax=Synechocystis sp. PCC 7509 TaxID=927677 RepID=UPI0002ACCEB3|nr:alanine/ornithine racemase family PLP-dependent enzyme [Synechocystis sp. PCC 7509]